MPLRFHLAANSSANRVQRWLWPTVGRKAIFLATLATALAATVTAVSVWQVLSRDLIAREDERLAIAAFAAGRRFDTFTRSIRQDATLLAAVPAIRAFNSSGHDAGPALAGRTGIVDILKAMLDAKQSYQQISFFGADAEGRELLRVRREFTGGMERLIVTSAADLGFQPYDVVGHLALKLKQGENLLSPVNFSSVLICA